MIDEELIALLEQALEMTPEDQPVTRVIIITRLCGALYFSPDRRHDMRRFSAQATAIAARLGDPLAAALAAAARRRAYWGPGHLERRLADSTQLLRSAHSSRASLSAGLRIASARLARSPLIRYWCH